MDPDIGIDWDLVATGRDGRFGYAADASAVSRVLRHRVGPRPTRLKLGFS